MRRAEIEKLSRQIQELERQKKASRASRGVNEAESAFLLEAEGKGQAYRHGWPDFLLIRTDGSPIGVEVKRRNDWCSPSQVKMFAVLESIGIPVYVWEFESPGKLTPWRKWAEAHRPKPVTAGGALRGTRGESRRRLQRALRRPAT